MNDLINSRMKSIMYQAKLCPFIDYVMLHTEYCKFGNFCEGFIFPKLRKCEICENKTLAK